MPDAGVRERDRDPATTHLLARDPQRAAAGHRLTGVEGQIEERLPQHRRVAVDLDRSVALEQPAATPVRSASGLTIGMTSSNSGRQHDRLQLQIFGPRELQEALHHLVEPSDLAGDDIDVLNRLGRIEGRRVHRGDAARRAPPRRPAADAA